MLDIRDRNDQQLHQEEHSSSSGKAPSSDDHGEVDKSAHREQADTTNSDSSPPASVSSVAGIASTAVKDHRTGRWTPDEKILFLYGLKRFGKGRWKKMSIYLPHRSLVQIKSHAQKVLKRLEAGENVFRRLDENHGVVNQLILQAAEEQLSGTSSSRSLSAEAKRKRTTAAKLPLPLHCPSSHSAEGSDGDRVIAETSMESKHQDTATIHGTRTDVETPSIQNANSNISEHGRGAVIAAAALCQLSAIGGAWDSAAGGSLQEV